MFLLARSAVTNLVLRITELSGPRILSGLGCRARVGGAASPSQALRPKAFVALSTSRATDRYEQPTSGYQRTRLMLGASPARWARVRLGQFCPSQPMKSPTFRTGAGGQARSR